MSENTLTIRVPFSDAQIEAMAEACFAEWYGSDRAILTEQSAPVVTRWRAAIRAALAAGGLEPCAVTEYDPNDVALRPERASDEELAVEAEHTWLNGSGDNADRYMRMIIAVRARVEAPLLAEIAELRSDRGNAVKNAADRLPDAPWKDKTATEAVWLLSLAVADRDALKAEVQRLTQERGATNELYALRTEVQRLEIECQDRAFYVTEFAAVSKERDALKARVAELEAGKAGWCETDRGNMLLEMSGLREQLDAAQAECDAAQAECKHLNAIICERKPVDADETRPVKVRWDVTAEQACSELRREGNLSRVHMAQDMDYLSAHAVIDVPAGVADIYDLEQKYNRAWRESMNANGVTDKTAEAPHKNEAHLAGVTAIRNAVLDGVGGEMRKLDYYKKSHSEACDVIADLRDRLASSATPTPDRKCMSCGAYYEGRFCKYCNPTAVPTAPHEPIASPEALEQLAEIGRQAWHKSNGSVDYFDLPIEEADIDAIAAILRAAKPRVDVTPDELSSLRVKNTYCIDLLDTLNSRIVYGVTLPADIGAPGPLITVPKLHTGPTRAEAEAKWKELHNRDFTSLHNAQDYLDWLLPQLPNERAEMPSRDELAWVINAAWRKHCKYPPNPAGTAIPEEWDAQADAALDYLRPWLHTPNGWELDVTAEEAEIKYLDKIESYNAKSIDAFRAVLDLCRSRIRPTFGPCKDCAAWKATYERDKAGWQERAGRARAALEDE